MLSDLDVQICILYIPPHKQTVWRDLIFLALSMNNVGSCGSQPGNCHREDGGVLPCQGALVL